MSDADEQVVTVVVDVKADDGAPDPSKAEVQETDDTEQQQDGAKPEDSGSEDEVETGSKEHVQSLSLNNETETSNIESIKDL